MAHIVSSLDLLLSRDGKHSGRSRDRTETLRTDGEQLPSFIGSIFPQRIDELEAGNVEELDIGQYVEI